MIGLTDLSTARLGGFSLQNSHYFLTFRKKRYKMRGHVRIYVRPIGENDKLS